MFEINKLKRVKLGIAISIAVLMVISFFIISTNANNIDAFKQSQHSASIIVNIYEINSILNKLESSQRGYMITGDASFLDQYRSGHFALAHAMSDLRALVRNNPVQKQNMEELQGLIKRRLSVMKRNFLTTQPATSAMLVGKLSMISVMLQLDVMKSVENVRMEIRREDSQISAERTTTAIISAIVFVTLVIITASIILIQEYTEKVDVEKKLRSYQQLLKEKIDKLNTNNQELEQFAYIASHDLQEPLRKIITFSDRINQKFINEVTPDMKDYLVRISAAAARMRSLIDDLLAYSRTANKMEKAQVNLEQVISTVKDTFEVTIQARQVKFVHHDKLPVVFADKTQMIQLFQNLVSNAIKFTKPGEIPVIAFSSSIVKREDLPGSFSSPHHDQYHRITLTDNGIGLSEADTDRIFIIFKRLHGHSEYEGSGIGLSVCKKIVQVHDGHITVESSPGNGAAFSVYLPK